MKRANRYRLLAAAVCSLTGFAGLTRAASPDLVNILPRGAQRGTEVDVVFKGVRLDKAQEALVYSPGLTVEKLTVVSPTEVKAHLKISADCKFGEHAMRLRCSDGITELRNFFVDPYPLVDEEADIQDPNGPVRGRRGGAVAAGAKTPADKKAPSTFDNPQAIPFNVTVTGVVENEQADYYSVECKKGERLTCEIEAMRLGAVGQQVLDPYIGIFNTDRFEVAASDDTALLRQDSVVSFIVPKDGKYIIQVRDSSYGGGPNARYRMHVGTFPRPLAVYPAGGKAGEEVELRFVGDVKGEFTQKYKIPNTPGEVTAVFAEQNGLLAPSGNVFRISDLTNNYEAEPNDDPQSVSLAAAPEVPAAFNGILDHQGDVDFFRFKAKKGQALEVNVYGRRVRSPIDPVLTIHDAKGNQIAANDDAGGSPDSYLRFNPPADGEFMLSVKDHRKRGGKEFVYRVEVTPVEPKLTLSIPNFGQNGQPSQERQTIVVPRGGRFGSLIRGTRNDVSGDFTLAMDGLPQGVTMKAQPLGADTSIVLWEAAPDAPVAGKLVDLVAKPADDKATNVTGKFVQTVALSIGPNNNQAPYHFFEAHKMAIAVVDEVPFALSIEQPKAPLAQTGAKELKIRAERKGDFKGPINVKMIFDPPGTNSNSVTIPADKDEVILPVSASGNAGVRKWQIGVLGQADVNGQAWVASPLADLDVVAPYVGGKIPRTPIEQGKAGQVKVELEQKAEFPGKAKVELLGLPNGVTAEPKEITSADKEVVFDVTADAKAPAGTHQGLLIRVTVTKDGEPVVQNVAQGGVLRIDPPGGPKKTPAAVTAPKK